MDLGCSTWNCLQCPPAAILNRSGPRKQPVGNQLGWVSHCKERYFIIIIIVGTYLQTCAKGDYTPTQTLFVWRQVSCALWLNVAAQGWVHNTRKL